MQRYGDEQVKMPASETYIVERILQPPRHRVAQVNVLIVFEVVDQAPNDAATPINRDRCLEMQFAMAAVRARKRIGNRAGERLGANLAERRHDPHYFRIAIVAKIF